MAFLSTNSSDQESPTRFELVEAETTLGRHPECTIVVDAGAVSRYHAKVTRKPDGFVVEDSGSRNGTYLNGQLLSGPQFLREGDLIAGLDDVQFSSTKQMVEAWGKALEGEKTIHVLRGGKRLSFRVEMSKLRGRSSTAHRSRPRRRASLIVIK